MQKNMLIVHGGGPTAVMNASLYGAVQEAKKYSEIGCIYGAINGTGGLLQEKLLDMGTVPDAQMDLLCSTPGSAIGTSRDHIPMDVYPRMAEIVARHGIAYILCNGGNGTMDTCGKLLRACRDLGHKVGVVGIPKTMDNDLAVTDHSPGYGSAARYMAQSVQEVCADVRSMPIHVVVVEASGRNAGWITAASALARQKPGDGPDLIYLPERPFVEEEFLVDVQALIEKKRGVVVVASEGLCAPEGKPIVPPIFEVDRSVYYGDVSAYLANLVIQKLGYKARGEKPGLLGRASITMQSPVDCHEAEWAGRLACRAALEGETGKMVAFRRISTKPYAVEPFLADIDQVMLTERTMPDAYINARGNDVTEAFVEWCAPLLGAEMPQLAAFN